MKVYSKLNLIAAFIIMLLFVSCSSEDSKPTTPSGSGFAPSNVSGMVFEWKDPNYMGGNVTVYKINFNQNNSGKMVQYFATTESDITTHSCNYKKTAANTAAIDIDITFESMGTFNQKFKFDLTFTSKDGGKCIWMEDQSNSDTSITPLSIEGTFTLKK